MHQVIGKHSGQMGFFQRWMVRPRIKTWFRVNMVCCSYLYYHFYERDVSWRESADFWKAASTPMSALNLNSRCSPKMSSHSFSLLWLHFSFESFQQYRQAPSTSIWTTPRYQLMKISAIPSCCPINEKSCSPCSWLCKSHLYSARHSCKLTHSRCSSVLQCNLRLLVSVISSGSSCKHRSTGFSLSSTVSSPVSNCPSLSTSCMAALSIPPVDVPAGLFSTILSLSWAPFSWYGRRSSVISSSTILTWSSNISSCCITFRSLCSTCSVLFCILDLCSSIRVSRTTTHVCIFAVDRATR